MAPTACKAARTAYVGPLEVRSLGQGGQIVMAYPAGAVRLTAANNTWAPAFLHKDHLGSVRAISGPGGAVEERTLYRPYGAQSEVATATLNDDKSWLGERYDAGAGLQYLNARYYDPELAMFLQPDWFEVMQPGVGTNRYAYAWGDPVNSFDNGGNVRLSTGLSGEVTIGIGVGGGIGITLEFPSGDGAYFDVLIDVSVSSRGGFGMGAGIYGSKGPSEPQPNGLLSGDITVDVSAGTSVGGVTNETSVINGQQGDTVTSGIKTGLQTPYSVTTGMNAKASLSLRALLGIIVSPLVRGLDAGPLSCGYDCQARHAEGAHGPMSNDNRDGSGPRDTTGGSGNSGGPGAPISRGGGPDVAGPDDRGPSGPSSGTGTRPENPYGPQ